MAEPETVTQPLALWYFTLGDKRIAGVREPEQGGMAVALLSRDASEWQVVYGWPTPGARRWDRIAETIRTGLPQPWAFAARHFAKLASRADLTYAASDSPG